MAAKFEIKILGGGKNLDLLQINDIDIKNGEYFALYKGERKFIWVKAEFISPLERAVIEFKEDMWRREKVESFDKRGKAFVPWLLQQGPLKERHMVCLPNCLLCRKAWVPKPDVPLLPLFQIPDPSYPVSYSHFIAEVFNNEPDTVVKVNSEQLNLWLACHSCILCVKKAMSSNGNNIKAIRLEHLSSLTMTDVKIDEYVDIKIENLIVSLNPSLSWTLSNAHSELELLIEQEFANGIYAFTSVELNFGRINLSREIKKIIQTGIFFSELNVNSWVRGGLVLAGTRGSFFRAEILEDIDKLTYRAFLIDYGLIETVFKQLSLPLPLSLTLYPRLIVFGRLINSIVKETGSVLSLRIVEQEDSGIFIFEPIKHGENFKEIKQEYF